MPDHHRTTRREFGTRLSTMQGTTALASLLNPSLLRGQSHLFQSAKRVIFLFMGGGPSQLDMFDLKPELAKMHGNELPASVRQGQRLTSFTSGQKTLPVASTTFKFKRHGECGAWVSELLPHFSKVVDDVTFLPAVYTEAINHDPAMTFIQTGHEQPGRPSMGAWVDYGLGSETEDLPAFLVLHSRWNGTNNPQPIFARLWGSGFLPSRHQGVSMRSEGDPVLYLSNPEGVSPAAYVGWGQSDEPAAFRRCCRPRNYCSYRAVRNGVSDANLRPRVDGHKPRNQHDTKSLWP